MVHTQLEKDSMVLLKKAKEKKYLVMPNRKPRKDEYRIREFIDQMVGVASDKVISIRVSKALGKTVSVKRVKEIRMRMMSEARDEFSNLSSFEAALEAREEYRKIKNNAHQMMLEAELIDDQKESMDMKIKAGKLVLQAREAEDRMYKMVGIHQERILHEHINIMETEEWKAIQNGFLVYLTYVLECPKCGHTGFDPDNYFAFMDELAKDPHFIDQFLTYDVRKRHAERYYKEEDYVDVEVEDG